LLLILTKVRWSTVVLAVGTLADFFGDSCLPRRATTRRDPALHDSEAWQADCYGAERFFPSMRILNPMALKWRTSRHDVERENRRLLAEVEDLRRDNEDLRDAARSWRRLYERAVEREPINRRVMHLAGTARRP
jgi:hypothetical protein